MCPIQAVPSRFLVEYCHVQPDTQSVYYTSSPRVNILGTQNHFSELMCGPQINGIQIRRAHCRSVNDSLCAELQRPTRLPIPTNSQPTFSEPLPCSLWSCTYHGSFTYADAHPACLRAYLAYSVRHHLGTCGLPEWEKLAPFISVQYLAVDQTSGDKKGQT